MVAYPRSYREALELWALDQTTRKMNSVAEVESIIPSFEDIDRLERRLEAMKQAREKAREGVISNVEELASSGSLTLDDLVKLQNIVSKRLALTHVKRRGSRVSGDLRNNLDDALKLGEYSLGQLAKMFNLSISYVARRKNELGLTKLRKHSIKA